MADCECCGWDACRAHAAADQQASHLQQDLAALQHTLQADKVKYDRIMTALAAQSQQDDDEQQQRQQVEEEDVWQERQSRPQGRSLFSFSFLLRAL